MISARRSPALDAFRGLTIAGMILVNTPGSWQYVYPPLEHAAWHGWTPTDLIFPFFLFIVGISIHFSQQASQHLPRAQLVRKILMRSALLVLIGVALNLFPKFDLATWRIPGVLQRIGIVSGAAALLALRVRSRDLVVLSLVLLVGYWGLLALVPAPGLAVAELSPDGNLGAYVDRWLFGARLWYPTRDPEGVLSTLPALVTGLAGVLTGRFLSTQRSPEQASGWLFSAGWGLILLGLLWSAWFPINKNLWSSSFVLLTSGAALQAFGVCHWLIEVCALQRWATTFVALGKNALLIYVGSGLLGDALALPSASLNKGIAGFIFSNFLAPWAGPFNGSLIYALVHVAFWCGVALALRKANIVVKL